jgi:hypothetical protein
MLILGHGHGLGGGFPPDLRPWAIHPQAIWWTADSGVTRADATVDALSAWTPANLVDWSGSEPELIETADTGEHSINDTGTSSLVIGPTKLSVELESVNRDWAWVKLGTGTLIAHFDLANGVVGTVGAGAAATIEAGSETGRWRCTVYGVTAATNMAIGASTADGVTSYEGSADLSAIKARSPVLTQHRTSLWTSQVYGGAAGPTAAMSSASLQPYVQADSTSPGGLSVFGKPCIWNPTGAAKGMTISSAQITANGPMTVAVYDTVPDTLSGYVLRRAFERRYVNQNNSVGVWDGSSYTYLFTGIPTGEKHFIAWVDDNSGNLTCYLDGSSQSASLSLSGYGEASTYCAGARRELVIIPAVCNAVQISALRSGMLQRLAA